MYQGNAFCVNVARKRHIGVVTAIYVYPIKSCQGVKLASSQFSNYGLLYDRQWAIVSLDEKMNGGKDELLYVHNQYDNHPELASIKIGLSTNYLVLSHGSKGDNVIKVPLHTEINNARLKKDLIKCIVGPVQRTSSTQPAIDEGDEVAKWLTDILSTNTKFSNHKFRLVRAAAKIYRNLTTDIRYGLLYNDKIEATHVGFADTSQIHVINKSSLTRIDNDGMGNIDDIEKQFRPNIVVSGFPANDEQFWNNIAISSTALNVNSITGDGKDDAVKTATRLRVCMPALRCRVISTHQSGVFAGMYDKTNTLLKKVRKTYPCMLRKGCMFGVKLNQMLPLGNRTVQTGFFVHVTKRTNRSLLLPKNMREMRETLDQTYHFIFEGDFGIYTDLLYCMPSAGIICMLAISFYFILF